MAAPLDAEEAALASWFSRGWNGKPDHIYRELAGELDECPCVACRCKREGALDSEINDIYFWLQVLASAPPHKRLRLAARIMEHAHLPFMEPRLWTAAAAQMPDAIVADKDDLPLETVRRVPIMHVARMLRTGETFPSGGPEVKTHCPLPQHMDAKPSLSLNVDKNVFYCPVCGVGGDGIKLVMLSRGLGFINAVMEIYSEC